MEINDNVQNNEYNETIETVEAPEAAEATNPVQKLMNKLHISPKILIAAVAVIMVVVLAIILFGGGNSYKTPVELMEKQLNVKTYKKAMDLRIEYLNGFCESEMKAIYKIMTSSDDYKDSLEDIEELFEEGIEEKKDEYGKNYKYTIKITDKDKLSSEELRDFKKEIKELGDSLEKMVEETDDYDSDDWEDMADMMDISKSQAKKLIKNYEKIAKKCSKVKVTAGYELEIVRTLKGKEIDDPEDYEVESTINVYKVNGRWVTEDAVEMLSGMDIG
jgi:ferritin-like protein